MQNILKNNSKYTTNINYVIYLKLQRNLKHNAYLSYTVDTSIYELVINPKRDFRHIKKIMKSVKKDFVKRYGKVKIMYYEFK